MKRLLVFISLFLLSVYASAQIDKIISNRPSPPRLVNDFTGTLTNEQKEALEQKLYHYDDSTSTQIAVVIVDDLKGNGVTDFAIALGRKWGVGGKEFNNGVVILVAKNDRKITIQVGYGLEGAIPDVTAKSIIDNDLTPNFKQENYYRGLDVATDDIIKAAAGEYKAPAGYHKGKRFPVGGIIFLIIILFLLFSRGGGRGGGMMSRRGYSGFGTGWIIGSMMGGGRSGGWSGGGGSGGGFGGFGGGSFGGGGASGSW